MGLPPDAPSGKLPKKVLDLGNAHGEACELTPTWLEDIMLLFRNRSRVGRWFLV